MNSIWLFEKDYRIPNLMVVIFTFLKFIKDCNIVQDKSSCVLEILLKTEGYQKS